MTFQSSEYYPLTSSPVNNIGTLRMNRLISRDLSIENSLGSLPMSPPRALHNNLDEYQAIHPITHDPYADLDKSQHQNNFNSQLSLGIHHPQS